MVSASFLNSSPKNDYFFNRKLSNNSRLPRPTSPTRFVKCNQLSKLQAILTLKNECIIPSLNSSFYQFKNVEKYSLFKNHFQCSKSHLSKREKMFVISNGNVSKESEEEYEERPHFDLNLAVLLAGFAFESYNTPQVYEGMAIEKNLSGCETYYLSNEFVKELFLGQLEMKILKASKIPAMDIWGTSDPYVILKVGESIVQTKTIWKTLEPSWNENVSILIQNFSQTLQVSLWDANILLSHRRMGTVNISIQNLCDGKVHFLSEELKGMGGGGIIDLEIQFKTFDELEAERKKKDFPNLANIIFGNINLPFSNQVFTDILKTESISVSDFVKSALRTFKPKSPDEISDEFPVEASSETSSTETSSETSAETSGKLPSETSASLIQIPCTDDQSQNQSQSQSQIFDPLFFAKNTLVSAGWLSPSVFSDSTNSKNVNENNNNNSNNNDDSNNNNNSQINEYIVNDIESKENNQRSDKLMDAEENWSMNNLLSLLGLSTEKEKRNQNTVNGNNNIKHYDITDNNNDDDNSNVSDGVDSKLNDETEKNQSLIQMDEDKNTDKDMDKDKDDDDKNLFSFVDISQTVFKQTESILGSWILLSSSPSSSPSSSSQTNSFSFPFFPQSSPTPPSSLSSNENLSNENIINGSEQLGGGEKKGEGEGEGEGEVEDEMMFQMFCDAESAMEAWALLTSTLGKKSFVKSEFEKILFLENSESETQVAIWRDLKRKRIVFSFRGTEMTKIQDFITDISVLPVSFDAERSGGGNFAEEPMVHSGFLKAYDSVRQKLFTFVRFIILESFPSANLNDDDEDIDEENSTVKNENNNKINEINLPRNETNEKKMSKNEKWHIYITGHSLGGALATLFSKELISSNLAKLDVFELTMYNFGSPRVGNRKFVEDYNKSVKDSWRVVNRRDIIPTVPKLMGYCHVCCPVYLTPGNLKNIEGMSEEDIEIEEDGYKGEVLLETTPDLIFSDFMNGERRLIEKLIQVEISMLQCLRDGSALKMHMEDFYYISLLKKVEMKISSKSLSKAIKSKSIFTP